MKDLRADLKDLHRALAQTPATDGGRILAAGDAKLHAKAMAVLAGR